MKKILPVVALLTVAFTLACRAQEGAQATCKRHAEPEGGFSFCPPEGWEMAQDSRLKFKTAVGPYSDGHTPNISVIKVNSPEPLGEFVSVAIQHYPASAERLGAEYIKMLGRSEFTTHSKQKGIKLAFLSESRGLLLRTIQYFFSGKGDDKFLITCTALEKGIEALGPFCDRSIETLQIDK